MAQDYFHWILVVLQGYEVGYIPYPLGQYRWRAGSLLASQRRLLTDFVTIYKILLIEKRLEQTHGGEMAEVAKRQLYSMQRKLAYIERVEGSQRDARQRLWSLLQEHPFQLELYVDLAKTYVLKKRSLLNQAPKKIELTNYIVFHKGYSGPNGLAYEDSVGNTMETI